MELMDSFSSWKQIVTLPEGTVIFREKERADALYFILKGEVELQKQGHLLTLEREGGIIGEMAMIEDCYRSSTATAISPVRLARVGREDLERLIGSNPDFSMHLMGTLAERLRLVDNLISERLTRQPGSL